MELENTQNNALAKLPMLKLGEYEMWEIRIKQYFQIQDYALWEVIENGNSWVPIPVTTPSETGTSTEPQLVTYRKNEVLFSEEVAVLKREVGVKQYEINMLKTEFEKVKQEKEGIDFKIEKFENASKDLDKLLGSQITDNSKKGLGSMIESENSSVEIKKTPDAPIIEEWVSDDEEQDESLVVVEKKIVVPTIPKVNVVKSKQQEKLVRKPVKYAEMYRSQKPRGNQRNWNNLKSQQLGSDFVMIKKACYVCGSFEHLHYASLIQEAAYNAVKRMGLMMLKHQHVGSGCQRTEMMDAQIQGRQECSKEKEESREECNKSRKTKKIKCLEESSQQRK
ncbi:hypothetical protein Tco_1133967 [Tanacetum coccineum]